MKQVDNWHLTDLLHYDHGPGDPFAAAVRATRMPMVITDPAQPDNPIVFVNEAFQTLTGYSRDEIIGRNCRFLQGPETDRTAVAKIRDAVAHGEDIAVDLLNYRKDGSTFWNALYMSPVRSEDGKLRFFFASQLDVTDRIEAQRLIDEQKSVIEMEVARQTSALQAALDAKTLLLHEVDHRVKNNLTMIGALIRLQLRGIEDEGTASKLQSMLERVDALATVHRSLYQADDVSEFDLGAYTQTLVDDVVGASGRQDIRVKAQLEPIKIAADRASSVGLIINEIITNAIKHGLPDGGGTLTITGRNEGDVATIVISDDGVGMPDEIKNGLGTTFVTRLARQARLRVNWDSANPGTKVTLAIVLDQPS